MTRRKHKRSRKKAKFLKVQESSRKNIVSEAPHQMLCETDDRTEFGVSVRKSVNGSDDGLRNNSDKNKRTSSDYKKFDVALEKIGERLTANWREFRKIFAYLRQGNGGKTRGDADGDEVESSEFLLHKYKRFPHISISTLSLPSLPSVFCTSATSPRKLNHRHESNECERSKRETEIPPTPAESTTPRVIGLMKRCRRTTLTFRDDDEADEEEVARHRQSATRAPDITETDPLSEMKKDEERSLLLDLSLFYKISHQDSRFPESTTASKLSGHDCRHSDSLQKVYVVY